MDNSNSGSDTMQNGGNQEVLKLEIFHGKISFFFKKKGQICLFFFSQAQIGMCSFYAVQIIYVL
jgi:hypothetical protein